MLTLIRRSRRKKCATCGEEPFTGTLPAWHELLPKCTTCRGPLLALWPID
jgi:hypothetical protein